mmetsp:Transcript_25414/g.38533  ORF Transcript_25414/g.38533 Transcript_25414/m.38533 type:complete len:222 (+) Transcript_25414:177-842(+)
MKINSLLFPLAGIVLSFHSRLVESFVPCNDAFSRAQSIYAASLVGEHDLSNSSDQNPSDKIGLIAKISDTLKPIATKERKRLCMPEEVVSINEYKEKVVDEKEQMVVVRFYAPWCRACKAAQAPYRKLSRDFSDERIKFIECPVTEDNAFLHEGLGVPSLPFGHIYHPEAGLVEEVSINKKVFQDFERMLQYYVDGEGEVEYEENKLCTPVKAKRKKQKAS